MGPKPQTEIPGLHVKFAFMDVSKWTGRRHRTAGQMWCKRRGQLGLRMWR